MFNPRLLLLAFVVTGSAFEGFAQDAPAVTRENFDGWMTELSNWGRWGDTDELGAINFITPERRIAAAKLVREGVSVSLAHNVEKELAPDNASPFEHEMISTGRDNPTTWSIDKYSVSYHGYIHTHMDALCHMFIDGKMYNGFAKETIGPAGAGKLGIGNLKQGIFTRGILVDMPLLKGVSYLEPGTAIMPGDLEEWEEKAGIKIGRGDVVFVRTGRWVRRAEKGPWDLSQNAAGLHPTCMKWLRARDIAMLGCDGVSDAFPSPVEGVDNPIHQLAIVAMGMPLFDNCDLDALSEAAKERNRWEFLLTVAPLAVEGGTGSPLNPIATF